MREKGKKYLDILRVDTGRARANYLGLQNICQPFSSIMFEEILPASART
jgi:hypothetical protein